MKDIEYIKNKIRMNLDLLPQTLELLDKLKIEHVNGLGLKDKDLSKDIAKVVWSQFMEGFIAAKFIHSLDNDKRYKYLKDLNKKYYERYR